MDDERLTESRRPKWTRADDYLLAMARRRTARQVRRRGDRSEPEAPRFSLSTLPFLALIGGLAILGLAIMVAAFPGFQPQHKPLQPAPRVQGVAAKGWFQEAQREFHG